MGWLRDFFSLTSPQGPDRQRAGKHRAPAVKRAATPTPMRGQTQLKYGPQGRPSRTRAQLEDRRLRQPPPVSNLRKPGNLPARAALNQRTITPRSFAQNVSRVPPSVWWRRNG